MAKKLKKQEDHTNYSFLLKCMSTLTAAAIVTAGVVAAVSLNSAAATTTSLAAASMVTLLPAIPFAFVAIGVMLLLPFLFGCNGNTHTTVRTNTSGYASGSYGTNTFYTPYVPPSSRYHGHTDTVYTDPHSHMHGHVDPVYTGTHSHSHGHDGGYVSSRRHGHS